MDHDRPAAPGRWIRGDKCLEFHFTAFGGPCAVLFDRGVRDQVDRAAARVRQEALRIEQRYSRYRPDSLLSGWNSSHGQAVELDRESAALLDLAGLAHALSGGRFDITSGVLRVLWDFRDTGTVVAPDSDRVREVLARVGWSRLSWQSPWLTVPRGMELDLGGLGKEYAVDACLALLTGAVRDPVLVNFGGDLACSGPRGDGSPWRIGVEDARAAIPDGTAAMALEVSLGALATSGDSRRYLVVDGRKRGHILDPRTGWPVEGAPRSVTVAAPTCSQAGLLATLAMLNGEGAEDFLCSEGVDHWVIR
jgi:thiamine biosynthesis lipoprotein